VIFIYLVTFLSIINAKTPNKIIGSHAPNSGEKLDLFTITEKILSKKINTKPNVIPKARLSPIPPLLLKEETETAINVKTKTEMGRLHLLCLTKR
tara:strand:- start:4 stop:288 length:285 start_codon:yes stop_codon:yes gene_type:complete